MEPIKWMQVVEDLRVPAKPDGAGLWTLAFESLGDATKVRITAKGEWHYGRDDEAKCGPNGDRASSLPASRAVNPDAPIGALIAKIGGGTAEIGGAKSFVVGTHCVLEWKRGEGFPGSLFLTINDLSSCYGDNDGALSVQIALSFQVTGESS